MEPTDCYLCDSTKKSQLFVQSGEDKYLELLGMTTNELDLGWYICNNCGLTYRSPTLTEKEHNELYEQYDQVAIGNVNYDEYFENIVNLPPDESENYQKIKWLTKELLSLNASKFQNSQWSVLDIGCGTGTLLYSLSEQMNPEELFGVEPNDKYADMANKNLSAEIVGQYYNSNIFNRTFDLMLCTKVLEHLRDPISILEYMKSDISTDGKLFLEVPHMQDMVNFSPDSERFSIAHIFYFDEWSMFNILDESGWDIESYQVTTTPRDRSYLQIIAAIKSNNPLSLNELGDRPQWEELISK